MTKRRCHGYVVVAKKERKRKQSGRVRTDRRPAISLRSSLVTTNSSLVLNPVSRFKQPIQYTAWQPYTNEEMRAAANNPYLGISQTSSATIAIMPYNAPRLAYCGSPRPSKSAVRTFVPANMTLPGSKAHKSTAEYVNCGPKIAGYSQCAAAAPKIDPNKTNAKVSLDTRAVLQLASAMLEAAVAGKTTVARQLGK